MCDRLCTPLNLSRVNVRILGTMYARHNFPKGTEVDRPYRQLLKGSLWSFLQECLSENAINKKQETMAIEGNQLKVTNINIGHIAYFLFKQNITTIWLNMQRQYLRLGQETNEIDFARP